LFIYFVLDMTQLSKHIGLCSLFQLLLSSEFKCSLFDSLHGLQRLAKAHINHSQNAVKN